MPSPFPGMDPYLEDADLWPDVHGSLIYNFRAAIAAQLPEGYAARTDRYVWLQDADTEERWRQGKLDLFVIESGDHTPRPGPRAAVAEPTAYVTFPASKRTGNRVIKIIDQGDSRG